MKGEEVVRAAASRGLFLPVQSLSPRLGPGEEASKHKKGAWTHGRLSPQGLGPRRLGSLFWVGWGWGGVARGGGRLRGRGSGRQVAASGCRSAAWSVFQPADLAGLWGCTEGPKGDAAAAWAGNRTRASRVAGENSTTEPPMHRWPTPPDAAPEALTATRPAPLTARLSPVGIYLLHRSRRRRWGAGRGGDLKARIRARAGPQGAALSEGPTRPVARLLRRPRPPRPCRCRPRGPGADASCPAPRSLSGAGAGAAWSLRPRADVPLSDRRVPTQRRVSPARVLWRTARPRSGSDGVVVLVRRGPLAERLLARGLPAEAGSALWKGLAPARAAASPGKVGGAGRAPVGGLHGHVGLLLPPQRSTLPGTDWCQEDRCSLASRKAGRHVSLAGGRQVWPGQGRKAQKRRGHAAPPWRARRGLGRLGVTGERRRAGGAGAEDRVPAGGRAAGGGRASKAARASWPFPGRSRSAGDARRACQPPRGCVLRCGRGRGGAVGVGGWARVGEGEAGRQENQQLQLQPAGEERCAEED